jgi:hypothetical protein
MSLRTNVGERPRLIIQSAKWPATLAITKLVSHGAAERKPAFVDAHAERRLEVTRQPREQHVERPVVAEVVDDDRPHGRSARDPAPWNGGSFGRHRFGFDAATVADADCPHATHTNPTMPKT